MAAALAEHYKCGLNDLPINYAISWFEQKGESGRGCRRRPCIHCPLTDPLTTHTTTQHTSAVAVFLTMLHLGIQNIHLGPQLPAFVSPNVLKVLQDNYGLKPVSLDDHDRVRFAFW